MITNLQLLRNIGQFDSVTTAARIPLCQLALIYAENGRGKTTIAAIFRSLAKGDPIPIMERRRLAATNPPHVVVGCVDEQSPTAVFQNGSWTQTLPNIAIFDDIFVDQNIYSGLVVGSDHRQNLHELILGEQGVALNRQLQQLISQVETHNTTVRQRGVAIPLLERGSHSVDEFCALPAIANIEQVIQETERSLAASHEQNAIRDNSTFELLTLPEIDLEAIGQVLQAGIPELDAAAAFQVQAHFEIAGEGAERWIADGMHRQTAMSTQNVSICVFCAQNLADSPLIGHYRVYFGDAYQHLKRSIDDTLAALNGAHTGDVAASFERAVRVVGERREFWGKFCDLPALAIDSGDIARNWIVAREQLVVLLKAKHAAPLEPVTIPQDVLSAVQTYAAHRATIAEINERIQSANQAIAAVKLRTAMADSATITATLKRLRATRARYSPATAALCDAYLEAKAAKVVTERQRDQVRTALEQYRDNVFPRYQAAINSYLVRFNAGFHLDRIAATNTRGGPACTYNVVINNVAVAVAGGEPQNGEHSFRNTLSAGDRNALALAFFLGSLELDPNLANKIVVIDDPVSSLDDHRSLTTVQEIRRLAQNVAQILVLSHSKPFLCRIWEGANTTTRTALRVTRQGTSSTIEEWNVDQDSVTEHDRRHERIRAYIASGGQDEREIAKSLRPLLEAFFRVAYPAHFPPGTLLGPFRALCEQRANTPQEILNTRDIQELRDLVDYANRFHHDTNPAWQTEVVNEIELTGFANRALLLTTRR